MLVQFFPDNFVHGDLAWAWSRFEKMIGAVSQITNLASIFEDFMYQAYAEFLEDNVQYIEFRTLLAPICKVRRQTYLSSENVNCKSKFCSAGCHEPGLLSYGSN